MARKRHQEKNLTFFVCPNEIGHARMAVVVSKKVHKLSVVRHHLARVIRAYFWQSEVRHQSIDVVVLIRRNPKQDKASYLTTGMKTWENDWAWLENA